MTGYSRYLVTVTMEFKWLIRVFQIECVTLSDDDDTMDAPIYSLKLKKHRPTKPDEYDPDQPSTSGTQGTSRAEIDPAFLDNDEEEETEIAPGPPLEEEQNEEAPVEEKVEEEEEEGEVALEY